MSDNGYIVGSNLEKVLKAGHFAATGELGPPQSADRHEIEHKAGYLKGIVDRSTSPTTRRPWSACRPSRWR